MDKEQLYDDWVNDVCDWINVFFKKHQINDAVIQSVPSEFNHEIETMLIGICPHEQLTKTVPSNENEWSDRNRFKSGNKGNIDEKGWWNSFFDSIADCNLKPNFSKDKTVFMNRIYSGYEGSIKGLIPKLKNKGLTEYDLKEFFEKSADFTLRAIKDVFKPKLVVCLSVGWVYDYLKKRAGKNDFHEIWRGKYTKDSDSCKFNFSVGDYCGTKVIGIFHPTGARGIRTIDKELALDFIAKHINTNN